MEFALKKNMEKTWDLVPTAGIFAGQTVAQVEGADLVGARFSESKVIGVVKALWGISVLLDDVYSDPETIRAMCIGKAFSAIPNQVVVPDRDGFKDNYTLRLLKGAKQVMLLGASVYSRGQY